jgi:hypothetical protein
MPRVIYRDTDTFTVKETDLAIESPDPNVTYTLRPIPRDVYRKALASSTDKRTRAIDAAGSMDVQWALLDYALIGWSGVVYYGTNEPVPCGEEGKRALASDFWLASALVNAAGGTKLAAEEAARGESFRPPV